MLKTKRLTVDEFIEEYSKLSDARRYELQDGEVLVSPEPSPYHGRLQALILSFLMDYADDHTDVAVYGPTNVAFSSATCRGPDATVTLQGDGTVTEKSKLSGVPAVVIEIVSPSNPGYDLVDKRAVYCAERVPEIWFLDSTKKEAVFLTLESDGYREQKLAEGVFKSKVLKKLRLDVKALFDLDHKQIIKSAGK